MQKWEACPLSDSFLIKKLHGIFFFLRERLKSIRELAKSGNICISIIPQQCTSVTDEFFTFSKGFQCPWHF